MNKFIDKLLLINKCYLKSNINHFFNLLYIYLLYIYFTDINKISSHPTPNITYSYSSHTLIKNKTRKNLPLYPPVHQFFLFPQIHIVNEGLLNQITQATIHINI